MRKRATTVRSAAEQSGRFGPLSPRNPLVFCRIRSDWEWNQITTVVLARRLVRGYTLVGWLLDVGDLGLKDSFAQTGITKAEIARALAVLARGSEDEEEPWEDCPMELAQRLVYGALAWARQQGVPLVGDATRYLEILPPPQEPPDLSLFGVGGGPVTVEDDLP